MFRRPKISVYSDLKVAFDSIDRGVLWYCLSSNGMLEKIFYFSNLCEEPRPSSHQSSSQGVVFVRVAYFPPSFSTISEAVMKIELPGPGCGNSDIDICSDWKPCDLGRADDAVLLSEETKSRSRLFI